MVKKINCKEPKRIVFVFDDEKQDFSAIIEGLEQRGNKVLVIPNCVDLNKRVIESNPDIIIIDLQLPGLDGYKLCSMFRKQSDTQNIPVILINSSANKKNTKNAIDAGADDHISSPVQIEEVISRVNTQLELHALRNELKDCRAKMGDLANSEQQFRFLTEDSPDFVARYDDKCRKTYMSPRLGKNLGYVLMN
jgi:two-component system alkaline phosphatase synthesis response regulator PhoP